MPFGTKNEDGRFEIWREVEDKYEIWREIERYGGKSKDMAGRTHGLSGSIRHSTRDDDTAMIYA